MKESTNKTKNKGLTRLFSANSNGFGPGSKDKIDQLVRESKGRDVDEVIISSSDTR